MLLYAGLWLMLPAAGLAQVLRPGVPPPATTYLSPDFQPVAVPDSTSFRVVTSYRDSLGSAVVRVYYPSGKLKQYIPYANLARGLRYGSLTTWYEDGRMCSKEDFVNGVRHGDLLTYYPSGVLKRRERYVNGHGGMGTCYSPEGLPLPFFAYEQLPLYPGGGQELIKELRRAVRLNPQETRAMRRESVRLTLGMPTLNQQGQPQGWKRVVEVELLVAESGNVTGARVVASATPFLNNAALRAAGKLKRTFVPARRDGEVVKSRLIVPVYYTLESPPQRPGRYVASPNPLNW
nr:energy transducer TonB [Hymenobacter cyanobacteriorum]